MSLEARGHAHARRWPWLPEVIKRDREGNRLYTWFWPSEGRDRFREMHTMIVDADGNLYGSDNQVGPTQKLVAQKDADPKLLIRR
jgi:hypothetical protein